MSDIIQIKPLPCPSCGAEWEHLAENPVYGVNFEGRWTHPDNACFMSLYESEVDEDVVAWNTFVLKIRGQDEYRICMDGDIWCATGPGFINLQESDAGFGVTPLEAMRDLGKRMLSAVPTGMK